MGPPRRVHGLEGLRHAFDEVRFGAGRTLNLRASLPTPSEAAVRLDRWLRGRQMEGADEVLVITGRGNNSEAGVSAVREAALRTFHELTRKVVMSGFTEHTAGSFVVALAPLEAMLEARTPRAGRAPMPPAPTPPTLAALRVETRAELRILAERSLDSLAVRDRGPFVETEMLRLFGVLGAGTGTGTATEREQRLRDAIAAAMAEYD